MKVFLVNTFLVFSLLLLGSNTLTAQDKIHWLSVEEMQIAMKKEPRKVLIDVYTNWCGPCKMMMSQTFTDKEVIEYINANYYAVKFNAEGNDAITFKGNNYVNNSYNAANANRRNGTHEFTKAIAPVKGKIAYPTIVYFDESLLIITPVQGFWKAPQIIPLLHFIHDDEYKKGVAFDQYVEKYNAK